MSERARPDIVLVGEADFFLAKDDGAGNPAQLSPMHQYFLAPLNRLGLPYAYRLPTPPPLGVALLATYLRHSGFQVLAFDNIFRVPERRNGFFAALDRQPAAVGISTTYLGEPESLARIAGWARERAPGAKIVLGGFGAWRSESMRALGDVTVLGEGEETLAALLTALARRTPWDGIPNLAWRQGGKGQATPRKANFPLARRPAPDWDLLGPGSQRCYGVEASRGCPHACAFCAFPNDANQAMTTRPVGDVVAELRRNREDYGTDLFYFTDSNLIADPERAMSLCRAIIDAGLRVRWRCYARADDFIGRPGLAEALREAGCLVVYMGLESGSDEILRRMRKDCTQAQMQEGARIAKSGGLIVHGNFVIGFPGETSATIEETLGFIRASGIDTVSFTMLAVLDELQRDALRRDDRHLHLQGAGWQWSCDGMDSREAARLEAHCLDTISATMEQPLVCFQPTLFFPMLASGLGVEESLDLLRAFRDYRRGDQCADTTLREAALNRIRLLYSKMLSLSHAAQR